MILFQRLQMLVNETVSEHKKFAEMIGIQPNTFSHYITGKRKLPYEIAIEISKHTNCNLHWLLTGNGEMFLHQESEAEHINIKAGELLGDMVSIGLGSDISAGSGVIVEDMGQILIPKAFLKDKAENYFALPVNGESMQPSIKNGELAIIKTNNNWDIANNKIGAVRCDGETMLKRIQLTDHSVILSPTNPLYEVIICKSKDIQLLGILYLTIKLWYE